MTDVRTMKNTMFEYEERCKIVIPDGYYFVLKLIDVETTSNTKQDVSDIFIDSYSNCRLVLSYPGGKYFILFDPKKEQPDHVTFATELCSMYTQETGNRCVANIIEFPSQMKVFVYFAWTQKEQCDELVIKYSKGKINKENITEYTFSELQKILNNVGRSWDSIKKIEKYGTFYHKSEKGDIIGSIRAYDFKSQTKFLSTVFP